MISCIIRDYSEKNLSQKIKKRLVLAAIFKGKPAGTAQLTEDGWVCGMFVHNDCQGLGIGSKLIERLKGAARRRGIPAIRAHVALNAVDFYKKLGFRAVRKIKMEDAGWVYRMIARL